MRVESLKRILHYFILAVILLGVPALCAWLGGYDEIWEGVKSFPPRTEDWGFHPEKLWNYRRPFRWGAFRKRSGDASPEPGQRLPAAIQV